MDHWLQRSSSQVTVLLHHIPPRKMGQSLSICLQVEGLRLDHGVR